MKKSRIIFSLLVTIIAATFTMTANAQQRGVINWQNNGDMNAFLFDDVDSITYSRVGLDNRTYPNVVVQEVWKKDSVYRIPINTIDSVTLKTRKPVYKDSVFHIRDFHYPYVTDVTGLTITFDASIPNDSLPVDSQVVVSDIAYVEPFMNGFAGRVINIVRSGNTVRIECESVTLLDIFDEFMCFGKVVTAEDSIPAQSQKKPIIYQDDGTIIIDDFETDIIGLYSSGPGSVSLEITPKFKIDYLVYVALLEKPKLKFIVTDLTDCNFNVSLNSTTEINEEVYPDRLSKKIPIPTDPPIGLYAFFSLGAYFRLDAAANMSLNLPFKSGAQFGFDSQNKNANRKNLWLDFQPEWGPLNGRAKFNATAEAGIGLKAGLCIFDESAVSANFKLEVGPKISGNIEFSTNQTMDYGTHFNDSLTFTPLMAKLSGEVLVAVPDILEIIHEEWPIGELDLGRLFPALATRTTYLVPKFSKPHLKSINPLNPLEAIYGSLTAATTDISRNVLFPVQPGLRLYKNGTCIDTIYATKDYKLRSDWRTAYLQEELNNGNYAPGTTLTVKPCFKIFNGKYAVTVDSTATFTIPEPLSVQEAVTVEKGKTTTINFTGGWGEYLLYNKDTTVCRTTFSKSLKTITIRGIKNGTANLEFWDVRAKLKKTIVVTVTTPGNPVIKVTPSGDFGLVEMKSVNTKDFTITCTNVTGNLSISLTGDTVFKIISSNNNGFKIQFIPYKASTFTGTVTITASDGTKCTVPLTGESCAITGKDEVNFGDVQVGSNLTKIRKLTGYRCPEAITLVSKTGTKNYEFTVTPTSLPAAGDTLYLTFAPTVTGNAEAVLTFESGPATKTVTLKGNGVATPVRTVTPKSINFGDVALGDTKSALLTIKGIHLTGPLTVRKTNHVFSVNGKTEFTLTPKNGSIDTTLTVTYSPYSVCNNGGYIFITGGGVTGRDTVKLHGVGVIPEINFVPSDTIKFGTVVKGYSKTETLIITGTNLTGPLTVRSTNHVFTVNGKSQITLSPNNGSVNATVTVKYEPDKVQTNGGYVIISGGGIQQKKIGLKGKCEDGYITVNPGTLEFGNNIAPGKSVSRSFTVTTNVPGALSSSYTETVGGEFTVPSSIGAGTNTVTFKSSEAGSYSGVINIWDPTSGARAQVMMIAKVVPQILVDTESWSAGTVVKNYTATKTVNVTSKGFTSAMSLEIASSSNQFKVSKSTLGASGGSFVITYKPTAVGSHSATITISSVGPGGQVNKTINVNGKCEDGYITVTPGTLEFGDNIAPGKSVSRSFTLTTNVPGALKSSYTETVSGVFTVPSTIGTGTNTVTFKSSDAGSYSGVINIQDPISGVTAQVMMNAKVVPQILVDTETWSAGTVVKGYTATKTVKVTTKGFTNAMSLEIASSSDQFKVSKSTLGASGGSFVITYKPTAVGSHSATITISSVGPGGQVNKTINVNGKCEAGYITVTPGTLEFGDNIAPGKSVSRSFTLTTNVPGALSSSYSETVSGVFTVPSSIRTGTNTVTFKSSDSGSYSGVINIQDPKSGTSAQVRMNAKVVPPTITVNPSSLSFGSTPINSSSQETFTVTGTNLTGNLYLLPKSNVYSVSPSTISPDANGAVNQEVKVTFSPIIAKIYTSSVTVSGGGATTKTVSLTGKGIEETVY